MLAPNLNLARQKLYVSRMAAATQNVPYEDWMHARATHLPYASSDSRTSATYKISS